MEGKKCIHIQFWPEKNKGSCKDVGKMYTTCLFTKLQSSNKVIK